MNCTSRWSEECSEVMLVMVFVILVTLCGNTTIAPANTRMKIPPKIQPIFFFFMMKVSQIHCKAKVMTIQIRPARDLTKMMKTTRII